MNIIPIIYLLHLFSLSMSVAVNVPGPMSPAEYGEFGQVSGVRFGDRHLCVGSLITPSSLLTTATCCTRLSSSDSKTESIPSLVAVRQW